MLPFDAGRFLGAMLEQTSLAVYLKDSDGRYLFVNRRYEQLSGVRSEHIIGKTDEDLFAPEVAALFRSQDAEVAALGKAKEFEETIPLPGGTLSFITEKFPLLDDKGRVYAVGGFCAEITEKTRLAEESREDVQTLMKAIPDIFYRLDEKMNLADWNSVFEEVSGYSPEELLGMNALEFFDQDKETIAEGIREAVEKGHAYREGRFLTKPGVEIPYFWSGAALRHPDGSLRGLVGVGRDITESKRMEKDLLTMQKLESLGLMAGGIAHDFNNLLIGVLGNISLLQESDSLSLEQREIVDSTLAAARKARGLTLQLLTFAKGGIPKKELSEPAPLLREAALFAARGVQEKVFFKIDDALPLVEWDRAQISQVVHNLVLNAHQAMPEGGLITVSAAAQDGALRVEVSDTGVGISPDIIDKVFDPYFTTKTAGRGLGLASSRSIVEKHGGRISVRSRPGEGTIFTILLPASAAGKAPAGAPSGAAVRGSGRVLIMDDEPEVLLILGQILAKLGYTPQCVSDGALALEAYAEAMKNEPFRLVILDLTVPGGMGGKETAHRLLALDPAARIVVSSGYSDEDPGTELAEHRFAARLNKPYTVREVAQVLASALPV